MKKVYFIVSFLPVFLTLLVALMYASGLNYYCGYLRAFGIPYGIFSMGINDVLMYGGMIIAVHSYKPIVYAIFFSFLMFIAYILLGLIIDKLNFTHYFQDCSKKNVSSSNSQICFVFIFGMILLTSLMFVFCKVIQFSSENGEKMGDQFKTEYNQTLLMIKNKHKVKNTYAFMFKNE